MNFLIVFVKGTISFGIYRSNLEFYPLFFIGSLFTIACIGIVPPIYGIFDGIKKGIILFNSNIAIGIILILASFLPSLIASILACKMVYSLRHAFIGLMFTMILSSTIMIILYIVNPAQMSTFVIFLKLSTHGSIVVWIFILGVFNGFLWSGIAALIVKEDKI